jgi:hypothetical protein
MRAAYTWEGRRLPPPPLFGWEEEEEKKGGKEMRSRKRRETNDASGERQSITALCTSQTCATGGPPFSTSAPLHPIKTEYFKKIKKSRDCFFFLSRFE